jgi:hypothetical protein
MREKERGAFAMTVEWDEGAAATALRFLSDEERAARLADIASGELDEDSRGTNGETHVPGGHQVRALMASVAELCKLRKGKSNIPCGFSPEGGIRSQERRGSEEAMANAR